jgi:hypothetical protein
VLRGYEWANGYRSVQRDLEFLAGTGANDPEIDGWTFLAPLLAKPREDQLWPVGERDFTVKFRQRVELRVGVYTEPFHKEVANVLIGADPIPGANDAVEHYRSPRRGVFLFYPVTHVSGTRGVADIPTMGFALLFPGNHIARAIVFGVRDPSQPDSPVVDELGSAQGG